MISLAVPPYNPPETTKLLIDVPGAREIKPVVACVWWGDKYSSEYVERLRDAVKRNMERDYDFVCLTDRNPEEYKDITGVLFWQTPYPEWEGWWQKIRLFDPRPWLDDTRILMLDLDIVITGPLDDFFRMDAHTAAIANFGINFKHSKYNSSVVCWDAKGPASTVFWEFIETGPEKVMQALHGDQCFFWRVMKDDCKTWPKEWCVSYKYEVRGKKLHPDTRAVVFHGDPKPDVVKDKFVIDNWLANAQSTKQT